MLDGSQIDMKDPSGLCGQCHGPIYSDWQQGIHGKLSAKGTATQEKINCTTCHNPHDPKFKQFMADPAPKKPKLLIEKNNDSVNHKGVSHGE
jgi:hypothetical protein